MKAPLLPFSDPADPKLEAWHKFHRENPRVWFLFERFALEALRSCGSRRIGARMVWERIRWETRVAVDLPGDSPKLNDHLVPYYAREFVRVHPRHAGAFELRALASERTDR